MSADIISLDEHRQPPEPGNGAREALIEIGENCPFHVECDVVIHWADDLLVHLWMRGFKIVPVDDV